MNPAHTRCENYQPSGDWQLVRSTTNHQFADTLRCISELLLPRLGTGHFRCARRCAPTGLRLTCWRCELGGLRSESSGYKRCRLPCKLPDPAQYAYKPFRRSQESAHRENVRMHLEMRARSARSTPPTVRSWSHTYCVTGNQNDFPSRRRYILCIDYRSAIVERT